MSKQIVKVRVFTGKTLEDACSKADDLPLEERSEKFESSHVVPYMEGFAVIIMSTHWTQ